MMLSMGTSVYAAAPDAEVLTKASMVNQYVGKYVEEKGYRPNVLSSEVEKVGELYICKMLIEDPNYEGYCSCKLYYKEK